MDDKIRTAAEAAEADVLARLYEVHTDPKAASASDQKVPKGIAAKPVEQKSPAQWAYERVVMYLRKFEETLNADQEVAMGFTGADAGVLRIEGMGYFDPDVITFYGTDPAGGRMQHIQHVSQLNVILRVLPKAVESAEPNRIGFRLAADLDQPKDEESARPASQDAPEAAKGP